MYIYLYSSSRSGSSSSRFINIDWIAFLYISLLFVSEKKSSSFFFWRASLISFRIDSFLKIVSMYSFYFYYFACGRQVVNSPLVSFDRGLVVKCLSFFFCCYLCWFFDPIILLSDASGPRGLEVRGHGTGSAFLVDFHDGRSTGHGGHYPTSAHFVRRSHSDRYQTVGNCCRSPGQRSRISRRYSAVYRLIHFNVFYFL